MNIGIDMELIRRFRLPKKHALLKRVFTKIELDYAFSRPKPEIHLCGFFCAKEAVKKIERGRPILMKHIEIIHRKNGEPVAKVKRDSSFKLVKVSISHAGDYAISCAIG
jgi:holo-[acyl-carrier protein] synthase